MATQTSRLTMAAGSAAADGGAASPWAIRSGDLPALLTSLLVHVIVLLALGLVVVDPGAPAPSVTVIESAAVVEDELPLDPQEMVVADEPLVEAGAGLDQSAGVAQALAPVVADVSVTPVTETDVAGTVHLEPLDTLPTAQAFDERIVVRGATGFASTGAAGAVDRLTAEIAASLDQRPTVVCWVFDRSVSLSAQRQEIAGRLTRVFDELGANRSLRNRPSLSNLVVAFGKDVQLLTPKPTAEVAEVIEAINAVPVDESGVEMTFHAVRAAAEAARIFRTSAPKRNVMIVVFTDEVGNDVDTADAATKLCLTLGIPVYVVGVPAPFGIREVRMKYVEFDPKYDQGEQWAVIEQGPETGFPEVVHIRSDRLADEAIDSGFGPFRLSKLCADTGGIYFRVHGSSDQRGRVTNQMIQPMQSQLRYFFDPQGMIAYQPDYRAPAVQEQDIRRNKAKSALVEAARSSQIDPMDSPRMVFPRQDEGTLAQLLTEAQRTAARTAPRIDDLHSKLSAGLPDRPAVTERRWQAAFDLALGRVLAAKVRTDAYNQMLAQAKLGMKFKDARSDTWTLEPSDEVSVGSQTEKLAKQARELLERVVAEHDGTPWALVAAEELRVPLGYRWTESHTGVNDPKMQDGNGNPVPTAPSDDKKRMLAPPKPKRDLKRL
ncbi:MAG: VWA domain-containing protein [Planctomycetes bacterium]|nr:VWA domain-containing protein [Planctomycetota bacterium]